MPVSGSIDITMYNERACGSKSPTVEVLTICDTVKLPSTTITDWTKWAPADGKITLVWTALPAIRKGELSKINWYTKYYKNSFHHKGDIAKQNYHKGT